MTGGAVLAASLAVPGIGWAAPRPVELELVGRTPAQGAAGAEIAAHDPRTQRLYVTNAEADALDIYDARRPGLNPVRIDLSPYGGGPNSVDVAQKHGGIVAVAVEAEAISDPGTVELFDTAGRHLASVPAGPLPDMVTFTHDEHHLLVANEGERQSDDDDAEGSVTVIDIRRGARRARARTATLDGVPTAGDIRTTVGMEPEYIAPAPDDRLAYVSIQEANAIGVLDVDDAVFRVIRGLGAKSFAAGRGNALDPSDRDGDGGTAAIRIAPWPVNAFYMPDAVAAYRAGGRTWVATANEGDFQVDDADRARVNTLDLDDEAFPDQAALKSSAQLGRLRVSNRDGDTDGDGDFDALYAAGGRSMSILDARGALAYDTGPELERITAALDPLHFNADHEAEGFDARSPDKGPEPEGVDTGVVRGRTYAFLAAERSGGILAYDLSDTPGKAGFAGYTTTRPDDLGPEGVRFVPAEESPTRGPLVLVTHEITGTVAVFAVR